LIVMLHLPNKSRLEWRWIPSFFLDSIVAGPQPGLTMILGRARAGDERARGDDLSRPLDLHRPSRVVAEASDVSRRRRIPLCSPRASAPGCLGRPSPARRPSPQSLAQPSRRHPD
jgi:hypothetical protein